jgi:hypothetical protein
MTTTTAIANPNLAFIKYWGNHDKSAFSLMRTTVVFSNYWPQRQDTFGTVTFTKVVASGLEFLDTKPAGERTARAEEEAEAYAA